ncbi:universal stress protein [Halobaculum sp. MBLA0143]|uniref:universal stress protein n=1 Tax=Halobaculum sp. MBLA0143 TaxID=3079933 RepID=UPI0035262C7B
MYDRILLSTDGTRTSDRATTQAVELAAAVGATVHALYVVDDEVFAAYSGDEFVAATEGPEHGLVEVGRETLAAVTDRCRDHEVAVETALEYGQPAETIADYADRVDADLLVLGTGQQPEPYRRLLGSVTNAVAQTTARPTLVVKTPPD